MDCKREKQIDVKLHLIWEPVNKHDSCMDDYNEISILIIMDLIFRILTSVDELKS
jgi:hypothetical protein